MSEISKHAETQILHALSFFALNDGLQPEFAEWLSEQPNLDYTLSVADLHHIRVRLFAKRWHSSTLQQTLEKLGQQNLRTVEICAQICDALEKGGCPAMAIKSTDHWPDLGNDFDLFTTGTEDTVARIMGNEIGASMRPQSWGDKLASKWNFEVPNLKPLVEIHIGRLGQTGELTCLGRQLIDRRRLEYLAGIPIPIPSPEDQIVLSALQRLYRHLFFRICDFVDGAKVLGQTFDYEKLRAISKEHGLWQGVATHLRIISEYVEHYRGSTIPLPAFAKRAAKFGIERLYPHAGYLRIPVMPHGARLYGHQVIKTLKRGRHTETLRLGLLPPLAAAAGAAFRISGKRDGVW